MGHPVLSAASAERAAVRHQQGTVTLDWASFIGTAPGAHGKHAYSATLRHMTGIPHTDVVTPTRVACLLLLCRTSLCVGARSPCGLWSLPCLLRVWTQTLHWATSPSHTSKHVRLPFWCRPCPASLLPAAAVAAQLGVSDEQCQFFWRGPALRPYPLGTWQLRW